MEDSRLPAVEQLLYLVIEPLIDYPFEKYEMLALITSVAISLFREGQLIGSIFGRISRASEIYLLPRVLLRFSSIKKNSSKFLLRRRRQRGSCAPFIIIIVVVAERSRSSQQDGRPRITRNVDQEDREVQA